MTWIVVLVGTILTYGSLASSPDNCRPTSHDIIGPYYFPNAPLLLNYCTGDQEHDRFNRLFVHGYIFGSDCTTPMRRVKVEVWQADHSGNYSQTSDCRGKFRTDNNGYYEFSTIKPGKYGFGGNKKRPAHIHFRVLGKRRHKGLVTQMYFAADSSLGDNDPCNICNSERSDLIVQPEEYCDGDGECIETARFDIVLQQGRGIAQTRF